MSISYDHFRPFWPLNRQLSELIGASFLGAVGSLPLHVAPIVISALVASGAATVQSAAWIVTAAMAGQICSATALPSIGIGRVGRMPALIAGLVMVAGLCISMLPFFVALLGGWFVIGLSCGAFRYLSALSAAGYPNRPFAFGLRLAIVLVVASAVLYAIIFFGAIHSYRSFAWDLQFILLAMLTIGMWLYRPRPSAGRETKATTDDDDDGRAVTIAQLSGLAAIFILFAGQVGFLSYVMEIGLNQGFAAGDLVLAITAIKFSAGIVLFYAIAIRRGVGGGYASILPACIALIAAIPAISYGGGFVWFFGGLLVFEIALNILSSRLQATVVSLDHRIGGRWFTLAILGGAAVGPPLRDSP
ncbi:MAG: hypothetical protein ACWGMZ_10930, partial [Thermoguttaceae bacterium]